MLKTLFFAGLVLAIATAAPSPGPSPSPGAVLAGPLVAPLGTPLLSSAGTPLLYSGYSGPLAYTAYGPSYAPLPYAYKTAYYV